MAMIQLTNNSDAAFSFTTLDNVSHTVPDHDMLELDSKYLPEVEALVLKFDFLEMAYDYPAGAQGIQGLKGDQGDQGIQGLKGDQGDAGLAGSATAFVPTTSADWGTVVPTTIQEALDLLAAKNAPVTP
jgi:hypothetical protein